MRKNALPRPSKPNSALLTPPKRAVAPKSSMRAGFHPCGVPSHGDPLAVVAAAAAGDLPTTGTPKSDPRPKTSFKRRGGKQKRLLAGMAREFPTKAAGLPPPSRRR